MQNRMINIVEFFAGDLTKEDSVKAYLKRKLDSLSGRDFYHAFYAARNDYFNGDISDLKGISTLGMWWVIKGFNISDRLPKNITDTNVNEKLNEFMLGSGGNDKKSFKYLVLENLFLCDKYGTPMYEAKTNLQAKNLIDMVLEVLRPKVTLSNGRTKMA